jgi:ribonuclease P protein component
MLPKKNRTDKKTVENIFKQGKFMNSSYFSFKFIKSRESGKKISFVVPKSVSKLAVKRNSLRRKGYMAIRDQMPALPAGVKGIFIFKRYEDDIPKLKNEIKGILDKIH